MPKIIFIEPNGSQRKVNDEVGQSHVLDGLLYHESALRIEEHYTDTAGFTDHVFAHSRRGRRTRRRLRLRSSGNRYGQLRNHADQRKHHRYDKHVG